MTFEVRNLGSFQEADGGNCGNSFFGTKGFYVRNKGFFTYKDGKMNEREAIPVKEPEPDRAINGTISSGLCALVSKRTCR